MDLHLVHDSAPQVLLGGLRAAPERMSLSPAAVPCLSERLSIPSVTK